MANLELKKFIKLTPKDSLDLDFKLSADYVIDLIGHENWQKALEFKIKSPLSNKKTTDWIKSSKIVGINPRITRTYWGIVKYALTFPENAIHIMPLFDTGDGSIYVQNSWKLNKEFYDYDLESLGFDSCEKQLKFVINVLHAMGKAVGFDALAHTDNFSEIVILNPTLFEWFKLTPDKKSQVIDVDTQVLGHDVENLLTEKLNLPQNTFSLSEDERYKLIFPDSNNLYNRRLEIRKIIRDNGYEPAPVVEHSPMRPIKFAGIKHSDGEDWAVYKIDDISTIAKIFGAITPYKFYMIKNGYPVKNTFDKKVVDYFINKIYDFQNEYDFDFLRADMAHNQVAHSHNEEKDQVCEEVWKILKEKINTSKPYFATFAEAFWGDYYINGIQDMNNKDFDVVLGNLNFEFLNNTFIRKLNYYINEITKKCSASPCIAIYTNDMDLPEHKDIFKSQEANECRYFIGLFMNFPSYMGIGYETKNLSPELECEYSNYYVKNQAKPYKFGENLTTFNQIFRMRELYAKYYDFIQNGFDFIEQINSKILCWKYSYNNKILLFAVNLDENQTTVRTYISKWNKAKLVYTNSAYLSLAQAIENDESEDFRIEELYLGECVIYEIE